MWLVRTFVHHSFACMSGNWCRPSLLPGYSKVSAISPSHPACAEMLALPIARPQASENRRRTLWGARCDE
jgi:hypothetical protein